MDPIKEAFSKIKEDILFLNKEIYELKESIQFLSQNLTSNEGLNQTRGQQEGTIEAKQSDKEQQNTLKNQGSQPFSYKKNLNSTGNWGVSTDRQTDRPTDEQTKNPKERQLEDSADVLFKLNKIRDNAKKMVQSLTSQELTVLCKIYELEETREPITYSVLAKQLGLTESSMRDYITRLLKKKAPLEKNKINNKQVEISLIKDTKILVPLHTLITLRNENNRYNE